MAKQNGDPRTRRSSPIHPTAVIADPKKFSGYVLDPLRARGKDGVFVGLLGYRAQSDEDAYELAATYILQARDRVSEGAYVFGIRDAYGQRMVIEIVIREVRLRSGWILRTDGTLALATPFTGFPR